MQAALSSAACTVSDPPPGPTASPLPFFTSTPPPLNLLPSTFYFHPPDPSALLRVLNYGIGLERDAWEQFDYGNFHGDFLTSPEARALFDFVQADFKRYYPNGIPHAGEMLTSGSLDPNLWFPPRAVWTLAQAGVVDLLREAGYMLEHGEALSLDPFTLIPIPLELDGDSGPEWIVEVNSTPYNLRGWLPLDEQDGYTLIPNDIQHENQARAQGVTTTVTPDLNGDGFSDFVFRFDGQLLGTQFGYLKVYGGVRRGMYLFDTIQLKSGEAFEIADEEIRVRIPRSLNFECAWTQTNFYRWQGEEGIYTTFDETPPETPFCQAAQALSALATLKPEERATLLENALANISSETTPSSDYLAMLHIHLAMAYASQGFDQQAVARLKDMPAWAGQVWDENENLPAFCNALVAEAERGTLDTTALARYFTPAAMFQAYGQNPLNPGALACPLQAWAENRLETLTPPIARVPGEFWPELGAALSDATPYQLDDDPEKEWIGWLDWEIPQMLLLDRMGEGWRMVQLAWKSDPLAGFHSRVMDYSTDSIPDILLLATFDASVPVSAYPKCWEQGAAQVSDLTMISWSRGEVVMEARTILCGEPPALESLSAAQLQDMLAETAPALPTLDDDPRGFYRRLEEQEALILSGNSLGARMVLEEILSGVPPIHPASGAVIPRILFGIGLSYEVEGEQESAITAYQDLITQWPASPWAWLAEARVSSR